MKTEIMRRANISRILRVNIEAHVLYTVYEGDSNEQSRAVYNIENTVKSIIELAPCTVNRNYVKNGRLFHASFYYDEEKSIRKIEESSSIRVSELPSLVDLSGR